MFGAPAGLDIQLGITSNSKSGFKFKFRCREGGPACMHASGNAIPGELEARGGGRVETSVSALLLRGRARDARGMGISGDGDAGGSGDGGGDGDRNGLTVRST